MASILSDPNLLSDAHSGRDKYESIPGRSDIAPSGIDQQQWSANPYANFDYRHTWWQKLWEGLGFRSKFDEYRDSMALNAREYDAQLAEKAHNEQYDSAAEQVARQRQAGINSDLAGNVDAGSSSGMEPDPNAPISPGFNDPEPVIQGFANTVMGIFTTAFGFAKDALSLQQMKNSVDAGNIDNTLSLFNLGYKTAVSYIPSTYPGENTDWINQSSDLAFQEMSPLLSRRQAKVFKNQLNALYGSAPVQADQWDSWLKNAKGKINTLQQYQSEFWGDGSDEVISDAARVIAKYTDKYISESSRAGAASAEYQARYMENLDPSLQASVENTTNRRNLEGASIDAILNEALNEIMTDLRDRSESGKRGHQFASAALLLFSLFRMINFSKSSGFVGNNQFERTSVGF